MKKTNNEMLKILGLVHTGPESWHFHYEGYVDRYKFTRPDRSRLYMGILKLMLDGKTRNVDEIYSNFPWVTKCTYNNRWGSHSCLSGLVSAGYIEKPTRTSYKLSARGRAYYKAATA